ncbi:Uncharacterised protein [Candidatus Tiddalikarchaeum anstoanum]|nr:Uncharacterised protein [Candidatus Tiddalikarchaeum anstoanum]
MEKNVGIIDRIIRLILAFIFFYLGLTINPLFYILALICSITAATSYCTIYKFLKITTINNKIEKTTNSNTDFLQQELK